MKKPTKMGTCYEDVFKHFCYENEIPGMEMVHGILEGRGELEGWIYGHAWLELGDVAFQPIKQRGGKTYGLAIVDRKEQFYQRYNINPKKLKRYTKDQAMKLGASNGNFGPWYDLGLGKDGYMYKGIVCPDCGEPTKVVVIDTDGINLEEFRKCTHCDFQEMVDLSVPLIREDK